MNEKRKLECREVENEGLKYMGMPVRVTGTVCTHPNNWKAIEEDLAEEKNRGPSVLASGGPHGKQA